MAQYISQSLSLSLSLKPSSKGCCPRFLLAVERSACSSVLCVQYFLSIHAAMDVSFLVDSVVAVSTISFSSKDSFSMQVCVQLQRIIHWQRAAATTRCRPPRCCAPCSNPSTSHAGRATAAAKFGAYRRTDTVPLHRPCSAYYAQYAAVPIMCPCHFSRFGHLKKFLFFLIATGFLKQPCIATDDWFFAQSNYSHSRNLFIFKTRSRSSSCSHVRHLVTSFFYSLILTPAVAQY